MKRIIMLLGASIALLSSGFSDASAQNTEKFKITVGTEIGTSIFSTYTPFTTGAYVSVGWQLTDIFYLGTGAGLYEGIWKGSRMIDSKNGFLPAEHIAWDFLPEVFADAQLSLSKRPSPFFLDFRVGGGMVCNKYLHDDKVYDTLHVSQWTVPVSLGLGKSFDMGDGKSLSVILRQDFKLLYSWNTLIGVSFKF